MIDLNEEFLNLYRDLEEVLAARAGTNRPGLVQEFAMGEGSRFREELNVFKEMRNLLSHHGKLGGEPLVAPSAEAVKKLRYIYNYAKNPPMALEAAMPRKELFTATYSDEAVKVAEIMARRGFSHTPILDERGVLTGVFSIGTMFSLAIELKKQGKTYSPQLKLAEMKELLKPDNHTTEQFAFVHKNATCYEIKKLFKNEGPDVRRVAAVFVTSNGKQNGNLLGMITPWDLLKNER